MRIKITLISIFFFLLLLSIKAHSDEPHYINGFKYNDQIYHEKIVAELKKNNIPIIVSDDGYVSYPNKYKQKVTEILRGLDNRPYSEFYAKKYADNFADLLDVNKIQYEVKNLNKDKIQIYWNYEDDNSVRKLKNDNLTKIFEKNTDNKSLQRKK